MNYDNLYREIKSLIDENCLAQGNIGNILSHVFYSIEDLYWVGIYLLVGNELKLSQFIGKTACTRIPLNKGVCGKAAAIKEIIVVDNVHEFEGHIACDSNSNSEIVLPLFINHKLVGVFDIDSPKLNRFKDRHLIAFFKQVAILLEKYI